MGLTGGELQALRIAALLHDLGMPAVAHATSASNRPLTTVEWGILKTHPVIAADILEQAPPLRNAVPLVYHHHERYDGAGYVLGLAGEQIPLGARVLSVADAYVSITSPRPYRTALTAEQALAELTAKSGTQFDPVVVRALRDVIAKGGQRMLAPRAAGTNNGRPKAAAIEAQEVIDATRE
jgi:HD-GYP domain-containing protein (c-di-GMP phosphodiesterase class II)